MKPEDDQQSSDYSGDEPTPDKNKSGTKAQSLNNNVRSARGDDKEQLRSKLGTDSTINSSLNKKIN